VYHSIMRWLLVAVLAGCGAQPNQPLLANAPRPNPAYIAGGAAAAAAAMTLADPDAASRRPESNKDVEKAPIKVKENVPADVLDRLDQAKPDATAQPKSEKPHAPKDALDFSTP